MSTGPDDVSAATAESLPEGVPARHPDILVTGRWVPIVYLGLSLALVPWIVVLAETLPDRSLSHNYRLAWVGFDVLLTLAMSRTAWLAWRRSPFVVNVASVTAALLVVDAWFDVTTASRHRLVEAFLLALLVELPLAVLSLVIAGRAQVQIAATGATASPSWLFEAWRRQRARSVRRGRREW